MMSFAGTAKQELCKEELSRRCCAQAEAYGVLLYCNSFSQSELKIVTESAAFARRLPLLFRKAFKVEFDHRPVSEEEGKLIFSMDDREKMTAVCNTFGYALGESLAHHINFAVLEEDHCRTAFLRGAFLAGGSVTDPEKGYHLEMATSHYHVSREMTALMLDMGFFPKETTRKSNYITYFKQSEYIEDFLTAIGAPLSAMEIMNTKLEKNLRSSINRRVNCDAANLDKAVDAAQQQLAAIRTLEDTVGLDGLTDKLKEAAQLRLEHPELTLSQLAELCCPPVTKSSLNHRLQKLMAMAAKLG
jgi:DNA-binding protein WhiA